MTLQEQYNSIKNGKGNKAQFLKQARHLFPQYINQYSDFDTATNVLKSKQIISEAAGGVVSKGFDIWDWKKILAEETKSVEKNTSKEVLDDQSNAYDNKDMKNADNVNFNEIMKGFYAELRDEKNNGKTGDEIKAMVVKNLAKDPLYYTKNGMFGEKGVGYTDEAPGLGEPKEPKGKHKSSGYGDLDTNKKVEKVKANVQDSLGDKEAKTSNPSKVKEMEITPQNSPGVKKMPMPGAEKKIKLKEEEIKWSRTSLNENYEILDQYLSIIKSNDMDKDTAYAYLENETDLNSSQIDTIINYAFPSKSDMTEADKSIIAPEKDAKKKIDKSTLTQLLKYAKEQGSDPKTIKHLEDELAKLQENTESVEEQKLRSLIQQIIKEELTK